MTVSGTHTEAVLNKLIKSKLIQLLLQTDATLVSEIADLPKEINPFVINAPFLYPLKTSENLMVF